MYACCFHGKLENKEQLNAAYYMQLINFRKCLLLYKNTSFVILEYSGVSTQQEGSLFAVLQFFRGLLVCLIFPSNMKSLTLDH